MQRMRLGLASLSIIVTLVYSLDSRSVDSGHSQNTMMIEGRMIYFDESISRAVRQNLINDVNALISQNSPDLKGVDLEQLKERLQKIVVVASDGKPFVGSGYRNGAVNFTEKPTVVYNYEKLKSYTQTQRSLVQWHEALGAMGYNDDNYLLSTAIAQKTTAPKAQLHPQIQKRLQQQMNEPRIKHNKTWKEKDGGASGVGGGGDGDIAEIKWALLSYMDLLATDNQLGNPAKTARMLDLTVDIPLESTEFISKYQVTSEFRNVKIARNTITDKACILVDPKDWEPVDRTGGVLSGNNTKTLFNISILLEAIHGVPGYH